MRRICILILTPHVIERALSKILARLLVLILLALALTLIVEDSKGITHSRLHILK